jgi:hypothetical protein
MKTDDQTTTNRLYGVAAEANQPVVAQIPQGYEGKISVRLLPIRDFDLGTIRLGCRPRKGGSRRDADQVPLPADLTDKLRDANQKVISWLNADAANSRLFLNSPVEALKKAGVELTRPEEKAIDRVHRDNNEAGAIAPGVRITDLNAAAHPTGRVGSTKPGSTVTGGREVGCGFKRKGKE